MLRVLVVVLAVPILGFAVSTWVINDVDTAFISEGLPPVQEICAIEQGQVEPEVQALCSEFGYIVLLQRASITAGTFGITIPCLFWAGSLVAGSNRRRLALIFPSLTRFVVLLLSVLVIAQGTIFTYAVYIGESYAIERVHGALIGAIGIGAIVAALALMKAAFTFGGKLQTTVTGIALTPVDAPSLFDFVGDLAKSLGAVAPTNIVVGLEPNFFVTHADVNAIVDQQVLKGETLFLSVPLCRLLTRHELSAVIGHELGHFRGEDTVYSMRFAPVYAGMANAIGAMAVRGDEGASGLAKLPALFVLSYMYEIFSRNERTISRERELLADQVGAQVSGARSLATALAKVSFYSVLWPSTQKQNIDRLSKGKITSNLSVVFLDSARYDVEHSRFDEILDAILEKKISHPTDSHPTFLERLHGLKVVPDDLSKDDVFPPTQSAVELIDKFEEIEERLTLFEHKMRVALGHVVVPENEVQNHLLNVIYLMTAAMVGADGEIDPREVLVAEGIGQKLMSDFDPLEFRAACKSEDPPSFSDLIDLLKDVLDEDAKTSIYRYLNEVASADGEVSVEERALLAELRQGFGIKVLP
jgi:Zn-dependent protease with chaperone function